MRRSLAFIFLLLLLTLILPVIVLEVEGSSSTNTLFAHAETTTIGGVNYYLFKLSSADGPATIISQSAATTGRKLMGRWVYSLNGILSIPASTWTVTYRAMRSASATGVVAHCDIDILIIRSDNTTRTTIATNVANSPSITLTNAWETLTGTYDFPGYTVVDQTDYLEVAYYIEVTTPQSSKQVRLLVDDNTLPITDQTKIENVIFTYPNQPPVASFTLSPSDPTIFETVTFNASASYDPDGSIINYTWDFGDGNITTVTNPVITHVYTTATSTVNYTVTLTVTDNEGLTSSAKAIVPVTNPAILQISLPNGTYVESNPDKWLDECWLLTISDHSGTFTLRINNTSEQLTSYDTHLIIALNEAGYNNLVSLTVDTITILKDAFKYGEPKPYDLFTWPSGDVYPTWFNDTLVNLGTIPPKGYKDIIVSVVFSNATGAKIHFDAYGSKEPIPPPPDERGEVTHNPLSEDSTVIFSPPPPPPTVEVVFGQAGVEADFTGTVLTVDDINYTVADLPKTFTWVIGSQHTFKYYSPLIIDIGKQYVWTCTSGLSTAQSGEIIVPSEGGSVIGHYKTQYYVTFNQVGVNPDFIGPLVNIDGLNYSVADLPISFWWDKNYNHTFSFFSPLVVNGGKRYVWASTCGLTTLQSGTITITSSGDIIGNYKTQYLLTVITDPANLTPQPTRSPLGEAGPVNSWWYDAYTKVTLTAQSVSGYTFSYWDVDGIFQGSGVNPISVNMNTSHLATAYYSQIPPLSVSINPTTAKIKVGESVIFTSTISGGVTPYKYQWYLNGTAVSGATAPTWTFTPSSTGKYIVYLIVTDDASNTAKSNEATVTVAPPLTVSISPTSASIILGQSVTFTSTTSGGYPPYKYQWYLNNQPVSGANATTWTFNPTAAGIYYVTLKVTDAAGNAAQSDPARITVSSVPVGGYSISITKQTSTQMFQTAIYTTLIILSGAVTSLIKRKRK